MNQCQLTKFWTGESFRKVLCNLVLQGNFFVCFFLSHSLLTYIFANLATGTFVLEKREDVPVLVHLVCLSYTLINDSETRHCELHFPHFQGFSAFLSATTTYYVRRERYNVVPQTPSSDTYECEVSSESETVFVWMHILDCMCGSFRILFQRKKTTTVLFELLIKSISNLQLFIDHILW